MKPIKDSVVYKSEYSSGRNIGLATSDLVRRYARRAMGHELSIQLSQSFSGALVSHFIDEDAKKTKSGA